jgi:superfamily I DNA and RNA helicase
MSSFTSLTRLDFNELNLITIILKILAQSFAYLSDEFVVVYSELCLEYQKILIMYSRLVKKPFPGC